MKRAFVLAVLLIGILTVGTLARADVPSSTTGEFTACRLANHSLRLIDAEASETCIAGEETVSWLGKGPTAYVDNTVADQALNATVASLTVPAGQYQIQFKARVENNTASPNFNQCGLTTSPTENSRVTLPASGWETVNLLQVTELTESTQIEVFCSADASADVSLAVLTATSLSAINAQ